MSTIGIFDPHYLFKNRRPVFWIDMHYPVFQSKVFNPFQAVPENFFNSTCPIKPVILKTVVVYELPYLFCDDSVPLLDFLKVFFGFPQLGNILQNRNKPESFSAFILKSRFIYKKSSSYPVCERHILLMNFTSSGFQKLNINLDCIHCRFP